MVDLAQVAKKQRDKINRKKLPQWMQPMLATLTDERFSSPDWIYERKFDGERCLVFRKGDEVRLMSRNRKKLNSTYPELVDALEQQTDDDFVADGEIVAFEGKLTSFSRLQNRMHSEPEEDSQKVKVYFYLFDLMHLADADLTKLPLRSRKALLRKLCKFEGPIRFTTHINEDGERYWRDACKKGWEGVIAKDANSTYEHSRSRKWLKFKCVNEQEFVIGGYTDPEGQRIGFGALLVGYYQNGKLQYAGKIGTGYDDETLRELGKRMEKLERKTPAFEDEDELPSKHVHWISPDLVCQAGFTEWTEDGKLRHPRYLGLRRDKKPKQVKREKGS
jgi:DNA ligase D-like protein (predicted ligase)